MSNDQTVKQIGASRAARAKRLFTLPFWMAGKYTLPVVYANICGKLSKPVNPRETYNGTAYKYSFIVLCLHTCTSVEYINMLQPS